jgi:aminoglycoside/choline kinase family phosphotransferase
MTDWLSNIDALAGIHPEPASADASFRRYFRLKTEHGSLIVMDAPPGQEDCTSFLRIAGYLEAMQINAPRIIEADKELGFVLLTDLGPNLYLTALTETPDSADALYADAIRALATIQNNGAVYQGSLPPYDDQLLRQELSLFRDWLCVTHLGLNFSADDELRWQATCESLVANALDQPQVFVHRDYHSRNLMLTKKDNPGILDFQDAVEGPLTYDLASLLKDCYVSWPAARVREWALDFHSVLDGNIKSQLDSATFLRHFDFMGVQRHLKAAGIFARLNHRDGKSGYMADIPRTLRYIVELGPAYEELAYIVKLISEQCLPTLEETP